MEAELISLFFVSLGALLCPIVSSLLPNRIIPETVFLLMVGMLLGPNVANIIQTGDALSLLSDLGLGFLFLLAGYEIDVAELSGKGGRAGLITWFITFCLALGVAVPVGIYMNDLLGGIAIAITLTTTAFGTLVPILKDRGLTDGAIGKVIVQYGVWGELCPVLAIALLLSTRAKWLTAILLVAFVAIAVAAGFLSKKIQSEGTVFRRLLNRYAETNAQLTVRSAIFLLITLVTISAVFELDIVLGSFAAGFVLRTILPRGDASLEHKLNGIAYGFFIPLFFIVSGTKIAPQAVIAEPLLLVVFILALLLIRAVPVYISLSLRKDTKGFGAPEKLSVSLYCAVALPLIVAVAQIATSIGVLSQEIASVLIAAGGITVLIMPLMASFALHSINAELLGAFKSISKDPSQTIQIIKKHRRIERERNIASKHLFVRNFNKKGLPDNADNPPEPDNVSESDSASEPDSTPRFDKPAESDKLTERGKPSK